MKDVGLLFMDYAEYRTHISISYQQHTSTTSYQHLSITRGVTSVIMKQGKVR